MVTNTKGFTGHAMGAGIEDVVAVKALETGVVPPVPNYKEPDPELGRLNLSPGGAYPVGYALRLAAGFGSQIAMTLLRWTPDRPTGGAGRPSELGYASGSPTRPHGSHGWTPRPADRARLEVVRRRLQVVDDGVPAQSGDTGGRGGYGRRDAGTRPGGCPLASGRHASPGSRGPGPGAPPAPVAPAAGGAAPPAAAAPRSGAAAVEPTRRFRAAPVVGAGVGGGRAGAAAPGPAVDAVTEAVVSVVAQTTGYPPELLDLDLDLEADLGVDTVKQAEIFAAVRERFGVERDDNLRLREFPTLAHVIGWIREKTGQPGPAAPAVAPTGCAGGRHRRLRPRRWRRRLAAGGG